MGRPYSQKFLIDLYREGKEGIGADLAKLCIECNLPAMYVARVIGVSRMTIYSWFRGGAIRSDLRPTVESFIKILKQDIDAGVLPARSGFEGKLYLEKLIETPT